MTTEPVKASPAYEHLSQQDKEAVDKALEIYKNTPPRLQTKFIIFEGRRVECISIDGLPIPLIGQI